MGFHVGQYLKTVNLNEVVTCPANPHSQAHMQFAQASPQTKNCKRACLSATADFADTKKLNLLI
jgi:hypothetical protein